MEKKKNNNLKDKERKESFPGYPLYPNSQDIYNKSKEEKDIDPEDPSTLKRPNDDPDSPNEKDFKDLFTGDDLDVPGSELDDKAEDIGSEDEENNYYSVSDNK